MALNTWKCNRLTPLPFKGLSYCVGTRASLRPTSSVYRTTTSQLTGRRWTCFCWTLSTTRLRCQCSVTSRTDASSRWEARV